jgi:hypothetical protein
MSPSERAARIYPEPEPTDPAARAGRADFPHGTTPEGQSAQPRSDAFRQAAAAAGELKDYATYYLAAKVDGIKVGVRNAALYAALGIVGAIAGVTMVAYATILLLGGLADGLGRLFGGHYWLGHLLIGLLVLGGIFGGGLWFISRMTKKSRQQTVQKYEAKRGEQRTSYGHDVHDRAKGPVAANGNGHN